MTAQRIAARLFALLLLLVALPICWYYAVQSQERLPLIAPHQAATQGEWIIATARSNAQRAGVRPGDILDLRGLGKRDIFIHQFGLSNGLQQYRIIHNGVERTLTLGEVHIAWFETWQRAANIIAILVQGTITILVAAIVLWRRPGPLAFALGLYAVGPIFSTYVTRLVTWLPDGVFWPVASAIDVGIGILPALALVYFAMVFPEPAQSARGRLGQMLVTALLAAFCVANFIWDLRNSSIYITDNFYTQILPAALANLAVIFIVVTKYTRASGQQRRRIAWVLAGVVISGICYVVNNMTANGFTAIPPAVNIAATLASAALPLCLAYAILRHRVLDIGFALNRTLVYATVTGMVVVVVSAVDWFSSRYVESSKFSLALEATVTIGFGVALNWFHRRIERGIDRVLFRERHRAQTRIETRIRALDFAESSTTVDSALVHEVITIMHLASAAVFRVNDAGDFVRLSAHGWEGAAPMLQREHVLLRTLRAEEETVQLVDHAIDMTSFPHGTARPEIAIPIGVRHQLLGCVLYGHRDGDATLDPEERALLEHLAHAGAVAYDAIEAAHWRNRALASESTLPPAAALLLRG